MGRSAVRTAIVNYIQSGITAGLIPNLNTAYAYPPKVTPQSDFMPTAIAGADNGAVVYLHIVSQNEKRIAIGGTQNGRKWRQYVIGLIVYHYGISTDSQNLGAENDALMDALVTHILADRNAGDPSVIFQWGEGSDAGGEDIRVQCGMPVLFQQQGAYIFSTIEVTAVEVIDS